MGLDYKTSTGLGETDSSHGGHKQNLACTKTQRGGAVTPQETESELPAGVGGSPMEVWVGRGSKQGLGRLAAAIWEGPLWCKLSWGSPLTQP